MYFEQPTTGSIAIGSTPISGGADTQVLYNDGGFVGSDAGMTFAKATDRLTLLGGLTVTQTLTATGTAPTTLTLTPGNHTATTASTEVIYGKFGATGMTLQLATGALTTNRFWLFQAPTISAVGATAITNAATVAITGAPVAGTNVTITNKYALWVQAGISKFDGGIDSPGSGGALSFVAGLSATAGGSQATAIGVGATASGTGAIAIGNNAVAGASASAISIGVAANSGGFASSIMMGTSATATAANQFVAGSSTNTITNVFFGGGVTAASPASVVYNATGGSGTDIAGATLTLAGGKGTGTGLPGNLIFQTSTVLTTGTTLQSLATRATISQLDGLFMSARFQQKQGTDAASATNLTLANDGSVFELTGTTKVDLISNVNWQDGSTVTLIANESVTIDHGTATSGTNVQIRLAAASDFAMTAGDTLTLCLSSTTAEGQAWRECSRTVI